MKFKNNGFKTCEGWLRGSFSVHGCEVISLKAMRRLTRHTDTVKVSNLVQAGGLIHAGVGFALVEVQLAAWPHVTPLAVTLEWTLDVFTLARMLTWVGTCLER